MLRPSAAIDTAALRKARGAFFTPEPLARYITDWAIRSTSDRVLSAFVSPEPSPGVPLTDPWVRQVLRLAKRRRKRLGTVSLFWGAHYRRVYAHLGVPADWITWWTGESPSDETRALRRLHRLVLDLAKEPGAQNLTVADAVSRLAQARIDEQSETALFRPSVRARLINQTD